VYRAKAEEVPLITKLISEKKIKVMKVKEKEKVKKLMMDFNIDRGEAEAILLALQKGCRVIATDDRNAIKACKLLKLDFITVISILTRAFEKGLIERDEALAKLDKLSSVGRYSKKIINDATERITGGF
jgi:predicted nucleic acid-binding protein